MLLAPVEPKEKPVLPVAFPNSPPADGAEVVVMFEGALDELGVPKLNDMVAGDEDQVPRLAVSSVAAPARRGLNNRPFNFTGPFEKVVRLAGSRRGFAMSRLWEVAMMAMGCRDSKAFGSFFCGDGCQLHALVQAPSRARLAGWSTYRPPRRNEPSTEACPT